MNEILAHFSKIEAKLDYVVQALKAGEALIAAATLTDDERASMVADLDRAIVNAARAHWDAQGVSLAAMFLETAAA